MGLHKQNMASVMSMPPGFRASRAAPALPSSLAGLVAWGEGSDLGADTTAISSWLNKTSSGLDPAQATGANQPTVKANAINGQKAALFTKASNQFLSFPAGSLGWFNAVAGMTLAIVVQPVSVGTIQNVFVAAVNASGNGRYQLQFQIATTFNAITRSDDVTPSTAIGTTTTGVGVPRIVLMASANLAGFDSIGVNGGTDATMVVSPAQNMPATNSQSITIGSRADATNSSDMYIAAYAMWNVAYSRSQLSGVLNRWATLYGITLTG